MTLNETLYAVVTEDGKIIGDGESPCISASMDGATEDLELCRQMWGEEQFGPFRIAKAKIVEVTE